MHLTYSVVMICLYVSQLKPTKIWNHVFFFFHDCIPDAHAMPGMQFGERGSNISARIVAVHILALDMFLQSYNLVIISL